MSDINEHEDIDFEAEDELGDLGALKAKLKKLKEELVNAKAERQEYLDGWQRCKADAINAKREALQDGERVAKRERESLIFELIPVLDSFDMAMGGPAWESVDSNWRSGVEHIRTQLLNVLSQNGVERFGKNGEEFNPHLHEAAQNEENGTLAAGHVLKVLRYGYKSGERILRPAQVIVSSG